MITRKFQKTVGLMLCITKPIYHTLHIVTVDSNFYVLERFVQLVKKESFVKKLSKIDDTVGNISKATRFRDTSTISLLEPKKSFLSGFTTPHFIFFTLKTRTIQ